MPSERTSSLLAIGLLTVSLGAFVVLTPPLAAAAASLEPLLIGLTVVLSWMGLGLPLARVLGQEPLDRALTALGLGMGASGAFTFVLGIAGRLDARAFAAALALGWILLVALGRPLLPRAAPWPPPGPWNAWSAAVLLLFLAVMLPHVVAPEASTDALGYHLLIPKIYLERGGIDRLPGLLESDYPCLAEYLYLPVLALFRDEIVCKCIHFLVTLAVLAAMASLSRKVSPGAPPLLAPALYLSMPIVAIHMGWAWNDFVFVLFVLLALSWLVTYHDAPDRLAPLAIAGAMLGLASWTKYTFLLYLLPLGVLGLWGWRARSWKLGHLLGFLGAMLAVAAPWIAKNTLYTGNPLFPFFSGLFPSAGWTPAQAAFFQEANQRWELPDFGWLHFLLFPLAVTLRHPLVENQTGVLPLAVIPLLLRPLARPSANVLRLLVLLTAVGWALVFRTKTRSLLALEALVFVLAAAALHEMSWPARAPQAGEDKPGLREGFRRALLVLLTAAVVVNLGMAAVVTHHLFVPLGFFFRLESREAFLARSALAQRAFDFLDAAPGVGGVALVGLHEPYYLDRPFLFASFGDTPVALSIAKSAATAEGAARWLGAQGITHLAVAPGTLEDPHRRLLYDWSAAERGRFEELLAHRCRRVFSAEGVDVYEIRPLAPPGPVGGTDDAPGAVPGATLY